MTAIDVTSSSEEFQDQSIPGADALNVNDRYNEERAKRLRNDGNNQYLEPSLSKDFQFFIDDPWADPATVKDLETMFPDHSCKLLILGAGWGGLLYAIRMLDVGFQPEDIRIIDTAGGFGGTWYWNRYPGLFCDIESYCYLPLLEETGYIPKHRYATGDEIRNYANFAAEKWGLVGSAVFQTKAEKLAWNEKAKEWKVDLVQERKGVPPQTLQVRASFVATVNGALNWPKLPGIPGIAEFRGEMFHSSRWKYAVTGGSPTDSSLTKLKDLRVAIVGTGATAVQIVPHLARWAKLLYVVQRTPASVDIRDQRETDTEWFQKEVAIEPGWQRKRMMNFHQQFTTEKQPESDLVKDRWTDARTMCAVSGNEAGPKTMDEFPAYMQKLHALDLPRQDSVRTRVEQVVKDPAVAKKLQAWYPTWCKRPTFHDEYLETFNRDNVTLVDTDGQGPERITADSIVAGGQSNPVDLIVFATGFRAPFTGSPAAKGNMKILGRNGLSMNEEWARAGPFTQHGVLDPNFPNLFLSGPWQASISPNNLFNTDALAKHSAYILKEARSRANGKPFSVSSTKEAAEDWGTQVMMRAAPMAAIIGCTPSYFNVEGELDKAPPEMQMQLAKSGLWGHGIEDFVRVLEAWQEEGSLQGVEIVI
ncbi:FAD/NAD(P)-binding domain-containing protein [Lophiostoma macrostomum CBS 122681]|uniref:FAD/NAD(P)-binding domain-containing protein n=1 Tax=Lophiostoma macrostomum CBS 122681 TaxID=1314788 RepID=A0A6A6TRC2_9PLEO|nr:FAD/NAD(P)-binding domain-containing protein [Lophiostoma macrostomum CBS 122681]